MQPYSTYDELTTADSILFKDDSFFLIYRKSIKKLTVKHLYHYLQSLSLPSTFCFIWRFTATATFYSIHYPLCRAFFSAFSWWYPVYIFDFFTSSNSSSERVQTRRFSCTSFSNHDDIDVWYCWRQRVWQSLKLVRVFANNLQYIHTMCVYIYTH